MMGGGGSGAAGTRSVGSDRGPHEERGGAGRGHRWREPVEGVKPAKLSSVSKVAAYIREAALEPGTTVAVVSMVGSLCPVTLAHVQALEEARAVLLGSRDGFPRPAGLEPFSSVVGLAVLNGDRCVATLCWGSPPPPPKDYPLRVWGLTCGKWKVWG